MLMRRDVNNKGVVYEMFDQFYHYGQRVLAFGP